MRVGGRGWGLRQPHRGRRSWAPLLHPSPSWPDTGSSLCQLHTWVPGPLGAQSPATRPKSRGSGWQSWDVPPRHAVPLTRQNPRERATSPSEQVDAGSLPGCVAPAGRSASLSPPLPFPALNTQHKHTRPGGYGEGPTIPDVEGLAHGASGEVTAITVTTCPLQGAPSARPRSRRTQGDAASGSPLPTIPSVEESAQEGPRPPVWGSPSDGAGGWDPWPPPSAVRQECAHEARGGVHGLRATAWVRIPPPLQGRLQWAGHEDHTGPESCHCALTSPPPAAPWAAAGEETGSRAPREQVRAGPAPGILTPGPVAGRQEVGKPASTNFNTTGHVTDWSPHAAAPGRAPDALCARPAVRRAAGLSPGLGSRLPSHSHPRHQALSSGTQKIGVGPLQRCEAAPHSLLPTPGPGYRPVRGVRGRKRATGSARSLGAEA